MAEYHQLVEKYWEFYKSHRDYGRAWKELYSWCIEQGPCSKKVDPRNSWVALSGRAFEEISKGLIVEQVTSSGLTHAVRVQRWDEIPKAIKEGILAERVWPRGVLLEPEVAESKVDVVAVALEPPDQPSRVISVYSCKSSLGERYQQDLFWAEKLRGRGIKFCLVTVDSDFVKYATGSDEPRRARKTVSLAGALYDRIYLLTGSRIVRGQAVFRDMSEVMADLDLWLAAY